MGIPPRRLLGWEPASRSWTVNGVTHTVTEPEWDWVDQAIVCEWLRLNERLCPQCHRPLSLHKAEVADHADTADPNEAAAGNYGTGFLTCPATIALDRAQAQVEKSDEPLRKQGLHPDRARNWLTWRHDEGRPIFDDD